MTSEHVRTTRTGPAQVTPYCARCRVPWPCPSAALPTPPAVEPPRVPLTTQPGMHCRTCHAPWPCASATRRTGTLDRHGSDHAPAQA